MNTLGNCLTESLRQQRRHCISNLTPLLFDIATKVPCVGKGLEAFNFFDSQNSIAPMKRAHVVRSTCLDCPRRKVWTEFQQKGPVPLSPVELWRRVTPFRREKEIVVAWRNLLK